MKPVDVSRRTFVVAAATAAAAPAGVPAAAAQPSPAPVGTFDTVPFPFDLAAFDAHLNAPYDHRQLFVAVSFENAATMLALMLNSLRAYADPIGFNAGPKALHVAGVFYHGFSVALALNDAMYARYPVETVMAELAGVPVRPPARPAGSNVHAAAYRELVDAHGAGFFVCNNALSGLAGTLARKIAPAGAAVTRNQVVAVHADLVANFLPGTFLVPAGVAAINAAAEARFTQLTVV